jgi:TonB family protein
MRLRGSLRALAIGSVASASFARAVPSAPPRWLPSGQWNVEYAENECAAMMPYKLGQNELDFGVRPIPTLKAQEIVVLAEGRSDEIEHEFTGVWIDSEKHRLWTTITPSVQPGRLLYSFILDEGQAEELKKAKRLRVEFPRLSADIPLISLNDVEKVLDHCVVDLISTWGLSREAQAHIASFPKPKDGIGTYFESDDYPPAALDRGMVGNVHARLIVGIDGKPRDCKIIRSSHHKDLDDITCQVANGRMRFEPARTSDGKPIESPFYFMMNWQMAD